MEERIINCKDSLLIVELNTTYWSKDAPPLHGHDKALTAPINSRLNMVVRPPTPFGLGRNGC